MSAPTLIEKLYNAEPEARPAIIAIPRCSGEGCNPPTRHKTPLGWGFELQTGPRCSCRDGLCCQMERRELSNAERIRSGGLALGSAKVKAAFISRA